MKLAWFGLLLIVSILAGGPPAPGQTPGPPGRALQPATAAQAPQHLVRAYFAAYLAWLNYFTTRRSTELQAAAAVPNKSLDPHYVTSHFIKAHQKLAAADERARIENERAGTGEIGILSWDPFICAQDFPDNMAKASVVLENESGNEAVVKVKLRESKNVKPFTVNLKKQKDGWRIDAIICPGAPYNIN